MPKFHEDDLLQAYYLFKQAGGRISETDDPKIKAGAYIQYAKGNLLRAIAILKVHQSGKWLDCPRSR